jgi:hypothetical protein
LTLAAPIGSIANVWIFDFTNSRVVLGIAK